MEPGRTPGLTHELPVESEYDLTEPAARIVRAVRVGVFAVAVRADNPAAGVGGDGFGPPLRERAPIVRAGRTG